MSAAILYPGALRKRQLRANPELGRRLREIDRCSHNRQRAVALQVPAESVSVSQWLALVELFDGRCAYCGEAAPVLTQDHCLPLARGGAHDASNIVPACMACNQSKGTRTREEFMAEQSS